MLRLRSSFTTLNAAIQHDGFIIYQHGKLKYVHGSEWNWIECPRMDEYQALSELCAHGYLKKDSVIDKHTMVFAITTEGKTFWQSNCTAK